MRLVIESSQSIMTYNLLKRVNNNWSWVVENSLSIDDDGGKSGQSMMIGDD